jgi:iron complex outermembrane recepter protein
MMFRLSLPFLILLAAFAQSDPLRGIVVDAANQPVSGLRVESGTRQQATTDGEGRFLLTGLPGGPTTITVTGKGYVPTTTDLTIPAREELRLRVSTVQTSVEVRERDDNFLATASVSATKAPEQLLNLPYAAQVLPRALLEDRAIQDVKDLYRNISGVTDSPYSAMTVRGFVQREVLFNGMRGNPYGSLENDVNDGGFSTSQGRLSNVEFVEVLKGPAALLYGAAEPGGIINFVTRKPRQQHSAEASFRAGSFRQRAGHLDLTGPLARNLFYRTAWYQEDRNLFRYNAGNENKHLASGLSWRAGEATSLGLEFEYVDQYLPGHRLRGIPVNAQGQWLAAREWNNAEPSDSSALQARVFQTRFDHAFTSTLRMDASFRYLNYDRPELYHEPRGINADGRTMRREFRNQFRSNDDYSFAANGYQRFRGLGTHNLIFGGERVSQDWRGRFGVARDSGRGGPVANIDLLAPVYGRSSGALYFIAPGAFTQQAVDSRRSGFFLQDQIEISPRLLALVGGRVERLSDRGLAPRPVSFEATAFTGRAGLVYRLAPRFSLFGNIANSFNRAPALSQSPLANGPHEPERGLQFEGGAKAELARGKLLANASLFRIRKNNVLRPDPAFGPTGDVFEAVLPVGEVVNQGLELDLTGRVNSTLSIVGNYAYLDSTIKRDRFNAAAVGRPMPNAARHAFGLFLRQEIQRTGTSLMFGAEARGRRYEPYANIRAAGYGILDIGLFQRLHKNVELRAQLDNAADRLYATAMLFAARAGNVPGNPRTLTFSLHFHSRAR